MPKTSVFGTTVEVYDGPWRRNSTLRCSFPEADIDYGTQHFGEVDDCNTEKADFAVHVANGYLSNAPLAAKRTKWLFHCSNELSLSRYD